MEQLKKMLFEQMKQEQETSETLYSENFKRLLFGLFKENKIREQINPCVWLYLNNSYDTFTYILQDIFQECYCNYLDNQETAYKETMKYVYNQYYKTQCKHRPVEQHEQETAVIIDYEYTQEHTSNVEKITCKELQQYYIELLERTSKNLSKDKKVFINGRQKQQTITKLQKTGLYDILQK
jgi:hypothetical protein